MKPFTIAHIINPFLAKKESDLYTAQPITFETMKIAKENVGEKFKVEQYAASFQQDMVVIPEHIQVTPNLQRSVLEAGEFKASKNFPLIREILDRVYNASSADYIIYTNVDIALMPDFYMKVQNIIQQGYSGFVINRRTISKKFMQVNKIPKMFKEAKKGEKHPGYDCFIFKRDLHPKFLLGETCVGANWIGRVLISNIIAFSDKFKVFTDLHLTFHIGDDRVWNHKDHHEFNRFNKTQLIDILNTLIDSPRVNNKKTLIEFHTYHTKDNPLHPDYIQEIIIRNSPTYKNPGNFEAIYPQGPSQDSDATHLNDQTLRQDPIFITGYPRSGTTLVQSLIATQQNIVSFPETHFYSVVRSVIRTQNGKLQRDCIKRVVEKIRERVSFSKNAETHLYQLMDGPGVSLKMLFELLVIDNLSQRIDHKRIENIRWMEKTPNHTYFLHLIFDHYPEAKVIEVMRHPEKAIISRRRHFAFNGEHCWPIEKHINDWIRNVQSIEHNKRERPNSIMVIKIEDVVQDTPRQLEKIGRFLDIKIDHKRIDRFNEISQTLINPWETWKTGVIKQISPDLAIREDLALSPVELSKLIHYAGHFMKRFGYMPDQLSPRHYWNTLSIRGAGKVKKISTKIVSWKKKSRLVKGKINLDEQLEHFYGRHRSGWIYAVRCLESLHNPKGIFMDAFIEKTFAWRPHEVKPHLRPWIGFIHVPPNIPGWFQHYQSNERIFNSNAWQKSLPYCRGLFTLSNYHRTHLQKSLQLPINNLFFPTETPKTTWSWERYTANKEKKIVQIGWWLRKIHAIFQLPLPENQIKKIFLKVNDTHWLNELIKIERDRLKEQKLFDDRMYDSAKTILYLENTKYDQLLAENIVFLNLYDSSANNTIIECIVRNTPLLINPIEPVVEYLGENYPFYYTSLEDAASKALDKDLIYKAHEYLRIHHMKEKLTGDYFLKSFKKSPIYKSLGRKA